MGKTTTVVAVAAIWSFATRDVSGAGCVVPTDRVDCGQYMTKQDECEAKGCCWSPVYDNPENLPWCAHPSPTFKCDNTTWTCTEDLTGRAVYNAMRAMLFDVGLVCIQQDSATCDAACVQPTPPPTPPPPVPKYLCDLTAFTCSVDTLGSFNSSAACTVACKAPSPPPLPPPSPPPPSPPPPSPPPPSPPPPTPPPPTPPPSSPSSTDEEDAMASVNAVVAVTSLVGSMLVLVAVVRSGDASTKIAGRFIVALSIFDALFASSWIVYSSAHFKGTQWIIASDHSIGNCAATGVNSAGLIGGVFTIAALLLNGISAITTHKVLSTEAEYAVYGVTALASLSAAVITGTDCSKRCYNETSTYQDAECNKFWLSLSLSLTSVTVLPLLLMMFMVLLGRASTKKAGALSAIYDYHGLNNDAYGTDGLGGGGSGGHRRQFQHALYLNLKKELWHYPVSYVVLVVTYISSALLTGKLERHADGGTIVWGGTLATVVQIMWILMAAQPLIHVCIYFRKAESRAEIIFWCPAVCNGRAAAAGHRNRGAAGMWGETSPMMRAESIKNLSDPVAIPTPSTSSLSSAFTAGKEMNDISFAAAGSLSTYESDMAASFDSHHAGIPISRMPPPPPGHVCSAVCKVRGNHNHDHSLKPVSIIEPKENETLAMLEEAENAHIGSYESMDGVAIVAAPPSLFGAANRNSQAFPGSTGAYGGSSSSGSSSSSNRASEKKLFPLDGW